MQSSEVTEYLGGPPRVLGNKEHDYLLLGISLNIKFIRNRGSVQFFGIQGNIENLFLAWKNIPSVYFYYQTLIGRHFRCSSVLL